MTRGLISRRCPILKDLQASNVLEANKFDVVEFQSMTMLVRANICDNYGFKFPLKAACNLKKCTILNYEGKVCELQFSRIQELYILCQSTINNQLYKFFKLSRTGLKCYKNWPRAQGVLQHANFYLKGVARCTQLILKIPILSLSSFSLNWHRLCVFFCV
ncbi:hypothetical protein HKD37_01G001095 [Glycine soja]